MTPIMLCLAFKITLLSLLCMLWLCRGAEAVYDTYYALPRFQDNTTVFKISIHTDTSQKDIFTNTPSHSLRSLFITFFTLLSHINLASFSHQSRFILTPITLSFLFFFFYSCFHIISRYPPCDCFLSFFH